MDARRESEPSPVKNPITVERKSDRELVVTRTFNGPARLVFEAWTKPELLRQQAMRWPEVDRSQGQCTVAAGRELLGERNHITLSRPTVAAAASTQKTSANAMSAP